MKSTVIALCSVLFLFASAALGATPVDERKPVDPKGNVSISLVGGDVKVKGWDQPEIAITGTLGEAVEALEFKVDGKSTRIEARYFKNRKANKQEGACYLEIKLPRESRLEVDVVSADVEVSDVIGRLEVETVSGNALVRGGGAQLEVSSVSGNVEAAAIQPIIEARMSTVSGNAVLSGALASDTRVKAESVSGNVTLQVPEGTSALLELDTFSGRVSWKLDQGPKEGQAQNSNEQLLTLGNGDGKVSISTFSGNVNIEKRATQSP